MFCEISHVEHKNDGQIVDAEGVVDPSVSQGRTDDSGGSRGSSAWPGRKEAGGAEAPWAQPVALTCPAPSSGINQAAAGRRG